MSVCVCFNSNSKLLVTSQFKIQIHGNESEKPKIKEQAMKIVSKNTVCAYIENTFLLVLHTYTFSYDEWMFLTFGLDLK